MLFVFKLQDHERSRCICIFRKFDFEPVQFGNRTKFRDSKFFMYLCEDEKIFCQHATRFDFVLKVVVQV